MPHLIFIVCAEFLLRCGDPLLLRDVLHRVLVNILGLERSERKEICRVAWLRACGFASHPLWPVLQEYQQLACVTRREAPTALVIARTNVQLCAKRDIPLDPRKAEILKMNLECILKT